MITGLDLVHLQIKIASGEKLPFRQEDITLRGMRLSCRIYAEDPDNNFFPSPGNITRLRQPAGQAYAKTAEFRGLARTLEYDPCSQADCACSGPEQCDRPPETGIG